MPTIAEIIDNVIEREGPETNDPLDKGGRTAYGISEAANPKAWADGKVTEAEAREIYERKYVKWPGFDKIAHPRLREHLIDYGVNSGTQLAIMKLQKILGVEVDGKIGPETLAALEAADPVRINNLLALVRMRMFGKIVKKDLRQGKYLDGWLARAEEFFII